MRKFLFSFFSLLLTVTLLSQKTLKILVLPADADIYEKKEGVEIKRGSGSFSFNMSKDGTYEFIVKKDGYLPISKVFARKKDGESVQKIELVDRVVKINTSPADSRIFINSVDKGIGPLSITIPKGQSITVDIKKPGFQTQSKTYYNKEGQDEPESSHLFKLEDRLISFKTIPADATVFIDDKKKGEGNTDIIIPKDKCVEVRIEKPGFVPETITYCNKDNEPVPPFSDQLRLKSRIAQINTLPEDASIFIDGKEVGKGSYTVKIPEGKCTEVLIKRASYVPEKREICNREDMQAPELAYSLKLSEDEAYLESEQSDKANRNFNVEVSTQIIETDAWKILSSIIMNYFDLEITDAGTGYLRTNWNGLTYNAKSVFPTVVRTRVIVTTASIKPLKYNVKIQSEISKTTEDLSKQNCVMPPLSMDQCFDLWPRILRRYNDLISEVQRRLQEK